MSYSSLCNICRDVDFHGMFTGRDYSNYPDGFNPYRADLDFKKQVPRTWRHIKMLAKCCDFCMLTFHQIQTFRTITRTPNRLRVPDPFPDAGENEMVITAVEIGTGMFDGEFTQCIGFHNGTYRHPSHASLMIRGLQLCSPERSHSAAWERARRFKKQAESSSGLQANKKLNVKFGSCFGGRLVGAIIDFGLCKTWLNLCNEQHKECREYKPVGTITRPNRLIDVQSNCIVSGSSANDGYAALSYVWGDGTPGTQLKTSNEEELRQSGSLSAPGIILGDTITDAMKFCRQIGVRFLWVDQLCIPQKPGSIDPEIHHMASIYSGATCTLVALSGTSFADPLPGVRPGTRHPEPQHQATINGLRLMTCYPSLFTEIESSVWFSRGWTFQEAAFSKRILFFTTSQTFFLCRETMYCEESVWEVPDGSALAASANTETIEAGRMKDLMLLRSNGSYPEGGYYRIVEEYTKRTLGHPEDILNAWAAAVQWMEEDKKWGSICSFGLPLDQFGFGLGWQPLRGHDPDPDKQRTDFPSWSWSGFQGAVEWCLEVPSSTRASGGARESAWGRSGIVQDTDIDITLRERYNKYLSPVSISQSPFAPQNPILEFKTSAAHITVSKGPDGRTGLPNFNMIGNDGYSIGSLQCDPGWRAKQPDKLEFIVFAIAKLTDPEPPQYSGYPAGCGTSRYNAKMSGRLFSDQWSYDAAVSRWQDLCSRERFVVDLMCISRGDDGLARRVQAADTFDDSDSTFSSTDSKSLESLRSSVLRFQEENGRTFHAMSSGKYNFPNDAYESDRLDLQHNLWLLTLHGELGLIPKIKEPAKRVMDVGTGTGIWATNMPTFIPKLRNLEPGGYLEMQDLTYPIACDDGTLPPDCEVLRSGLLSIEASAKAGRAINLAPKYKSFLEKSGSVDVVEKQFKWPINEWPKDKHYKELGKWSYPNINNGLEGLLLGLFTRFLGWSADEVRVFCSAMRKQLRDRSIHAYIPVYVVYGRKPLEQPANKA
ncbi:hypothetical protein FPHYL_9668 [Fusarium phyllophilum]|uniref:Heterokaryon incompatibility domain-containing protein n=1 Tax=Fusarium phyllophilum TaxID=47803 RepID=A0A8H5J755_9HYPO|nr:hypothetical protein FPHYL_9668 [Fusarium phyllophilum]